MISTSRVYDIVAQALQRCGAFAYGEQIDADLARTAILQLNILRASAAQSYSNWHRFDETYTATAGVDSVTLGPGGDFVARPSKIDAVYAIMGNTNSQLSVGTLEEYRGIPLVGFSSLPTAAYIETGFAQMKLWLYPGLGEGYGLRVVGLAYPADYDNIDDTLADPPEYLDWLIKATAEQVAPLIGDNPDRHSGAAQEAKDKLDRMGFATRASIAAPRAFNWLAGR